MSDNDVLARYDLTCWYLNLRRLSELFHEPYLEFPVDQDGRRSAAFMRAKARLSDALITGRCKSLSELVAVDRFAVGSLFTHWAPFYCKGLTRNPKKSDSSLPHIHCDVSSVLDGKKLLMQFDPAHFTANSSWAHFGQREQLFVLALVTRIDESTVEASPYVIASLIRDWFGDSRSNIKLPVCPELSVEEIDSFTAVKTQKAPTKAELQKLKAIPEAKLKAFFAEIIGEPFVTKDWGGEKSDLYSTRVVVKGQRTSSAFILKGPAKFHPMTVADLGKNGDQIDRLFSEPADLLIIQHCHEVTSAVRNFARMYSENIHRPRRFCVIDGADTFRLIKTYKSDLLD